MTKPIELVFQCKELTLLAHKAVLCHKDDLAYEYLGELYDLLDDKVGSKARKELKMTTEEKHKSIDDYLYPCHECCGKLTLYAKCTNCDWFIEETKKEKIIHTEDPRKKTGQ